MHSPSLRQTKRKPAKAAPVPAPELPAHLNFTFKDWLRQRTEPARLVTGWTPIRTLHADYVGWCEANRSPAEYVLGIDELSGRLRAHDDRQPETRLIERRPFGAPIGNTDYQLCFPRHLLPAIRVTR